LLHKAWRLNGKRAEQDGAMSKKIWFVLALTAAVGMVSCKNYGSTPNVVPTPTPIPNVTNATILATFNATPLPNLVVMEFNSTTPKQPFTPAPNATPTPFPQPTGPPIAHMTTNSLGNATFTHLTPGITYCWTYAYMPKPPPNSTINANICTNGWNTTVKLGT
jgi:hypothetical protein